MVHLMGKKGKMGKLGKMGKMFPVHLIVGYGQVGKSLGKVLGKHEWIDQNKSSGWWGKQIDVVHICIPYKNKEDFEQEVRFWDTGELVIVHSSVPVGTCDALGVVHSPICGVHPHLAEGIRTFVKYFGGKNAKKAAKIFSDLGIKTHVFKEARTTEAMKLWSTTQYGKMIMLEKEIWEWCQKNHLNFDDVYTRSNKDYNEGYMKLGMPQVVRPYLKHVPGPIGGHCVLPNAKLLGVKL
jgi:UDP-N-acetyl-D-mannosaminuronate dehydrogenase